MRRACGALAAWAWWVALALTLLWWTPSLALMVARLWGGLALELRWALVAVGCPGAAARVYGVDRRRTDQCMRERQEW